MNKAAERHDPGAALNAARLARGMTLRELATKTGIAYSTLSKLENGKMGITYDKLHRLALGLEIDVADLITGEAPADDGGILGRRSVNRAGKWLDAVTDRYRHHYPAAELLNKLMVPIIIDVQARSIEELGGMVKHEGEEFLFIVTGAMELHSNLYAPLPLKAGDSVYFDSGMAHGYVRTSDEPCTVLSVCAGKGIQRFAEFARRGG
ncbi:MAG: helix-turn-helix domain-containing protein [Sphingomonas sp.]